mgnify:CR=1 FL=1
MAVEARSVAGSGRGGGIRWWGWQEINPGVGGDRGLCGVWAWAGRGMGLHVVEVCASGMPCGATRAGGVGRSGALGHREAGGKWMSGDGRQEG